mmetsp:Transcript_16833/g.36210  ORF Transcript_16833/g.36210 Transcript_16833/m.36210 type:complete len:225 (-) Transcript_16833:336-1010(-)
MTTHADTTRHSVQRRQRLLSKKVPRPLRRPRRHFTSVPPRSAFRSRVQQHSTLCPLRCLKRGGLRMPWRKVWQRLSTFSLARCASLELSLFLTLGDDWLRATGSNTRLRSRWMRMTTMAATLQKTPTLYCRTSLTATMVTPPRCSQRSWKQSRSKAWMWTPLRSQSCQRNQRRSHRWRLHGLLVRSGRLATQTTRRTPSVERILWDSRIARCGVARSPLLHRQK